MLQMSWLQHSEIKRLTWFPGSWWFSPYSWGSLVSAAGTCSCHSCSRRTPAEHPLWEFQRWQKRPLHQRGRGGYSSSTPVENVMKATHLFSSKINFSVHIKTTESENDFLYLCSHCDVGYWRNASTGLWLLVLGSCLFEHLLPLTKRHNTPVENTLHVKNR